MDRGESLDQRRSNYPTEIDKQINIKLRKTKEKENEVDAYMNNHKYRVKNRKNGCRGKKRDKQRLKTDKNNREIERNRESA